ncbi:hypothetical protein Droror1_Dr00024922 [Drosera rotundifolia]
MVSSPLHSTHQPPPSESAQIVISLILSTTQFIDKASPVAVDVGVDELLVVVIVIVVGGVRQAVAVESIEGVDVVEVHHRRCGSVLLHLVQEISLHLLHPRRSDSFYGRSLSNLAPIWLIRGGLEFVVEVSDVRLSGISSNILSAPGRSFSNRY